MFTLSLKCITPYTVNNLSEIVNLENVEVHFMWIIMTYTVMVSICD